MDFRFVRWGVERGEGVGEIVSPPPRDKLSLSLSVLTAELCNNWLSDSLDGLKQGFESRFTYFLNIFKRLDPDMPFRGSESKILGFSQEIEGQTRIHTQYPYIRLQT